MNTLTLILDLVIIAGLIYFIKLQRKALKLDKKIMENWKKISEGRAGVTRATKEVEEMLDISGIKLDEEEKGGQSEKSKIQRFKDSIKKATHRSRLR